MFNFQRLARVLELHEKSFALLRWVRDSLKQGKISFSVVHQSSDTAVAAEEWIRRHLGNIPVEARPLEDDAAIFARLFVSFLTTSFRLNSNATRLISKSISRATWGSELLRRSVFASQGEAVLALWREFAWQNGSPKRKFKLTAQCLIEAEQAIADAIAESAN